MLPSIYMPTWNEFGVGLANHIWQSTLCMIILGALTLLFRRNSAVVRYRLWLIASVKFLVPFSLFIALGGLLQWHPVRSAAPIKVPVVVRQISRPFAVSPVAVSEFPAAIVAPVENHSFHFAFASVWFLGAVAVLLVWSLRWLHIAHIVRNAEPLGATGNSATTRILTSPASMEPGVFGIFRPVLLLPEGVARNLTAAQLEPIIAHEMFHVRGRDNLAAALHTIVEAMFWFHPLVWWLGNRLVDERERACDEAVLQMGFPPADYAEGILKVCKGYVAAPACVAGVSGSNLRKRIEVIMENRGTRSLTAGMKLLLLIGAAGVLIVPVVTGMMNAAESPIATVREMKLPVTESATSVAQPVTLPSSTPQVGPVANVQSETKTGNVQAGASAIGGSFIGLNYSTNNFLGYGETISADVQAGTRQSNFAVSMTEPYSQDRPVALLQVVPSPQQNSAEPTGQAGNALRGWAEDVSIIITDEERKAFQRLTNDNQRQVFITNFWLVRDPTPGTPANEFKDEYDRRVAYANEHFTTRSGIPGFQTDRGKMYILNGPPDEIMSHPSGGTYYRPAQQGGGFTSTLPFEQWRYRHVGGKGDNLIYEFVDKQTNGEYTLQYDPGTKEK